MKRVGRIVRGIERSVLLALLALPVLFASLGAWEVWRGAATRAEFTELAGLHGDRVAVLRDLALRDPQARVMVPGERGPLPVGDAIARSEEARAEADTDRLVATVREGVAWLPLAAGLAAGAAGLIARLLVRVSARQGMRSRSTLVAAFGRLSGVLPIALSVQVVGLVLALSGAAVFEVSGLWFMPDPDGRTVMLAFLAIVYAVVALWVGLGLLRNLRRALQLFVPTPLAISGVAITQAQAPGLFAMLRDLAHERGITPPDTVVAGALDGFFVTAFPTQVFAEPGAEPILTHGRVLHLPLPTVATFNVGELRTVLAHELTHFSGEDTAYGLRFAPLFAGLGQGIEAMSVHDRRAWGNTRFDRLLERAVHPHTVLAVHAFERFERVVAHWSRLRELEADRSAMASGSPAWLASSLLRFGLASDLLKAERAVIAERPDEDRHDLAATLVRRMDAPGDPAAHLSDQIPHPTDSHPPDWQRIEAAGLAVDAALLERAARPVSPADLAAIQALFSDWDALDGEITGQLRHRARRSHEARRLQLQRTADAAEGLGEVMLHPLVVRPMVALAVLGSVCLALASACVWAAVYGGREDRESWPLLFAVAAVATVILGFVTLWSSRIWRGRTHPFLVLDRHGVRSRGFAGAVRWLDVKTIDVSAWRAPTTSLELRPEVPLPRRTGLIRQLRMNQTAHAIQFTTSFPRELNEAAYRALMVRYARAAHAQQTLAAAEPSDA